MTTGVWAEPPQVEEFLTAWRELASRWRDLGGAGSASAAVLLREALDDGLPRAGQAGVEISDEDLLRCEIEVVRLSDALDGPGYLAANPGVERAGADPVEHFCRYARFTLHNPSLELDVWWYLSEHLDPADDRVNPLLYHVLVGRRLGLPARPHRPELPPPAALPTDRPVRRACLLAGYDVDGVIDDYVVDLVRELGRFCDVFYLADGLMAPDQLARLDGLVAGAWAVWHGEYDFGSWSRLAGLVGWDVLSSYDEVVMANDSVYLLRPLDDVFATMAARQCDWWGLQMTVRHFHGEGPDPGTVPVSEVLEHRTPPAVWHYDHFPHVGSYFLALRRRVIEDPGFRKRLEHVTSQPTKNLIIFKYETGTMFYLTGQGYTVSTYIDDLYPYHPIYSPSAFTVIGRGFPFLKRAHLVDNPYDTPDLVRWKERVRELLPDAPVEMLERNLLRVAADDKLQRSFAIVTADDGTVHQERVLRQPGIERLEARTPTFDHWWAFPVCAYDHTFAGNERAVFEVVRDDPSIKKVVLTRSKRVEVTGENVEVVPLTSRRGQELVVRCGQVFVKHSPLVNLPWKLSATDRNFINLWHGIPLKRFGWAAVDTPERRESLRPHHAAARAVITSSRVDSLAMAAAFYPLELQDMWPTGLPRSDFIVRDEHLLPDDLRGQEARLRAEVAGRRLVMFMPTFKDGQADSYYRFSDDELTWLEEWLHRTGAVLGVREHMADKAHTYSRMLSGLHPIDLSSRHYPDVEVLYRVAGALVTDYSSCLVDFMLTGRPVVSFAYDFDRYATEERGFFYDLDEVVPGPVCRTFDELSAALDDLFRERTAAEVEDYAWKRSLFFDHLDDQNARRVVSRVKALYVRGA